MENPDLCMTSGKHFGKAEEWENRIIAWTSIVGDRGEIMEKQEKLDFRRKLGYWKIVEN
jgi:hypothetical protein